MQACLEELHVHKKEDYQYVSYFKKEDSEYNSDLEQQRGSGCDSHLESDPSIVADFSMGRNAYQYYDPFLEHFEDEVVVDCIDNYMFLVYHSCDALNPAIPLSYDHSYEGETTIVGDQEFILKEQGGHLFASREAFTEEKPGPLKKPYFCHVIHDLLAIYMDLYVSYFMKFSNGVISPILIGEYGFMKDFQDQTIDPFPLLIKEKNWVEINHPRPAEDTEHHVKEELSGHFISYPGPVNKQISLDLNRSVSSLYPPENNE
jgi:hypothetical protein